jgi:hypothetical protein
MAQLVLALPVRAITHSAFPESIRASRAPLPVPDSSARRRSVCTSKYLIIPIWPYRRQSGNGCPKGTSTGCQGRPLTSWSRTPR